MGIEREDSSHQLFTDFSYRNYLSWTRGGKEGEEKGVGEIRSTVLKGSGKMEACNTLVGVFVDPQCLSLGYNVRMYHLLQGTDKPVTFEEAGEILAEPEIEKKVTFDIGEDEELMNQSIDIFKENGFPHIALWVGENSNNEQLVVLLTALGISPGRALETLRREYNSASLKALK